MAYAMSVASLTGMGLSGPGAEGVARGLLVELLTESAIAAEAVMPRGLAHRLLGSAKAAGLLVLDSVQEVRSHIEREIGRRRGLDGEPPWLFVLTTPGPAPDALRAAIEAGAECHIVGVVLDHWPYGVTCTVDELGRVTRLGDMQHEAPVPRLPVRTLAQATAALITAALAPSPTTSPAAAPPLPVVE
jgi:hypothetical protein